MNSSPFECYGKLALAVAIGLTAGKVLADRYIPATPIVLQAAPDNWYEQPIVPVLTRKRH